MIYHILNRANFRSHLFKRPAHYQDFLTIVEESLTYVPMRVLAYCLMPNHCLMVLQLRADGDLSKFLQRITLMHTQRHHSKTRTVGYGHVYQGRYKSLPVESDSHFLALVRYVERNARRAALVERAEDWPWCSVHLRLYGNEKQMKILSPWPMAEPRDYLQGLNKSQGKEEMKISGMLSAGAGRTVRRNGYREPLQNSGWKTPCGVEGGPQKMYLPFSPGEAKPSRLDAVCVIKYLMLIVFAAHIYLHLAVSLKPAYDKIQPGSTGDDLQLIFAQYGVTRGEILPPGTGLSALTRSRCVFRDPWRIYRIQTDPQTGRVVAKACLDRKLAALPAPLVRLIQWFEP